MKNDFAPILDYCSALSANNNREWFHKNHRQYEIANDTFKALLERLRFVIADAAPSLEADIMYMQVKDWMYRIPRDARMHNTEEPYNPAYRAYISADRHSYLPIGYFVRIAPGSSCFGTGIWCEDTAHMNIIRDYIIAHYAELTSILEENGLEVEGESLKKMPRGYENCTEYEKLVKMKEWSVIFSIPDGKLKSFDSFSKLAKDYVNRLEAFRKFMLKAWQSGKTRKQELDEFFSI